MMLPFAAPNVQVTSPKAKVLATFTYPLSDVSNRLVYASAISNPPMEATDLPAVVYHPYGKGACVYSCAPMEQSKVDGTVEVFNTIILSLLEEVGGLTLCCRETEYLEQVLRYHPKTGKYTLSLLNNQSVKRPVPLQKLEFSLQLNTAPKKVYTTLNTPVQWSHADGQLQLKLETLEIYDVITIEL